jgi:hypothetical protein
MPADYDFEPDSFESDPWVLRIVGPVLGIHYEHGDFMASGNNALGSVASVRREFRRRSK